MYVAEPNAESRESATNASPTHFWRANFRPAPPSFDEAPEAATERRAFSLLERACL